MFFIFLNFILFYEMQGILIDMRSRFCAYGATFHQQQNSIGVCPKANFKGDKQWQRR